MVVDVYRYVDGRGGTIYSFRVGDEKGELTKFLEDDTIKHALDFKRLHDRLQGMVDRDGFYHSRADMGFDRYFRGEPEGTCALWAPLSQPERRRYPHKSDYPSLRLYCFRVDFWPPGVRNPEDKGQILVAGSGGIKTNLDYKTQPELKKAVNRIVAVKRALYASLEDGSVCLSKDLFRLEGDLQFDLEMV